jgi:hypothetical protein
VTNLKQLDGVEGLLVLFEEGRVLIPVLVSFCYKIQQEIENPR